MAKSEKKRVKTKAPAKRWRRPREKKSAELEYVGYLLELHKLQGVLLAKLSEQL